MRRVRGDGAHLRTTRTSEKCVWWNGREARTGVLKRITRSPPSLRSYLVRRWVGQYGTADLVLYSLTPCAIGSANQIVLADPGVL